MTYKAVTLWRSYFSLSRSGFFKVTINRCGILVLVRCERISRRLGTRRGLLGSSFRETGLCTRACVGSDKKYKSLHTCIFTMNPGHLRFQHSATSATFISWTTKFIQIMYGFWNLLRELKIIRPYASAANVVAYTTYWLDKLSCLLCFLCNNLYRMSQVGHFCWWSSIYSTK